jgi:hypothetical protein
VKSAAVVGAADGAFGADRSTTTPSESGEAALLKEPSLAVTRYVHVPSSSFEPDVKAYDAELSPLATVDQLPLAFLCSSV